MMRKELSIGCCGWSYLRPREFSRLIAKPFASTLQAYVQLFDVVEVNSTFYRIPRLSTAEKWRGEANALNPGFVFTIKAYQGITHRRRFGTISRPEVDAMTETANALRADTILFQSPASFQPSTQNVRNIKNFFSNIDRGGRIFVWEPRGKWAESSQAVVDVCESSDLVHCVDPLRNQPLFLGIQQIAYFRLHGFGEPSMYRYSFSGGELKEICSLVNSLSGSLSRIYVFFNNVTCYEDALRFAGLAKAG
jgi:uncharacterized protein YecE (DUF72 family)